MQHNFIHHSYLTSELLAGLERKRYFAGRMTVLPCRRFLPAPPHSSAAVAAATTATNRFPMLCQTCAT